MGKKIYLALALILLLTTGIAAAKSSAEFDSQNLWIGEEDVEFQADDILPEMRDYISPSQFFLQSTYPIPSSKLFTYEQMTTRLQSLVANHPDLISLSVAGKSVDNRNIWAVNVGTGKKKILVTGALHAREWLTVPVLVQTIEGYVQDYKNNIKIQGEPVRNILDQYTITFMPMVNPDGVTLTQKGASVFTSKQRTALLAMNPASYGSDFTRWKANIRGVDLNRNFDVQWSAKKSGIIATSPYYAYYSGPSPESEPETKAVTNWVNANKPKLLLDYHSSGQILYWYYYQSGSTLTRDRAIVQALRDYSGYAMEGVNQSKPANTTLSRWAVMVKKIPSVTIEVATGPSQNLFMEHVPGVLAKTRNMALISALKLPDYAPYVAAQSVSLPPTIETVLGATENLVASFSPANASNKKVTWTSSDTTVATINATGSVTVKAQGTTTITATTEVGGKVATTLLTAYANLPRIKGTNRFDTAVQISNKGWSSAQSVVLVRSDDFADGLAGAPLAYQLDAPILLTAKETLHNLTKEEINRLGATKVYILGGTGAISADVENTLLDMELEVERISGPTRMDTAVEIAGKMGLAEKVILANGNNFPDALSVASYAASNGYPILLTSQGELPTSIQHYLLTHDIKETLVVGGAAAISDDVLDKLDHPTRIAGANRYDTAVEIAKYFNVNAPHFYLSTGVNYADALPGAVLAAKERTGLLLVGKNVPASLEQFITPPVMLSLFGGSAAIPTLVEGTLQRILLQ